MSSFTDLNNFSDNTVSFTDNRIPRPVFEQYLYAPDLTETINTTTFNPNNGEVVLESITRPADADLRYFVDVGSTGLSFSWGTLPAGVTATFTAPGYYEISNIQSSADFESITPVITIGTVLGEPEYSVGFKWVGGNVLDWTVTANIPVAVLESEFTLTAAALALSDGAASMTAVFSLTADPVAVEGSGTFTATTSMTIAPSYFRGIEAELDGAFTQVTNGNRIRFGQSALNSNATQTVIPKKTTGYSANIGAVASQSVSPNATFDSDITLTSTTEVRITEFYRLESEFSIACDITEVPFRLEYTISSPNTTVYFALSGANTFDIDWGDTNTETGVTYGDGTLISQGDPGFGEVSHTFTSTGTYYVDIESSTAFRFYNPGLDYGDDFNLTKLISWGPNKLSGYEQTFLDARSLTFVPNAGIVIGNASSMFQDCSSFNSPIDNFDMSTCTEIDAMFQGCTTFNQDINTWDVGSVTIMDSTFSNCTAYDQPLSTWDVSSVTTMSNMFSNCVNFNQNLNNWITTSLTNTSGMFFNATSFNITINNWNVSNVTNMSSMFASISNNMVFNQSLNSWNTANVTRMNNMFQSVNGVHYFNGNISSWNTSSVTKMQYMFNNAFNFNQNIGSWNTANVNDMEFMFEGATAFDQDIGSWDTGNVTDMDYMFNDATAFDQDLTGWCVTNITSAPTNFAGGTSGLSPVNYPVWGTCP